MVVPARRTIPGPIYICVNADESEPGTFINRVQMELDPHQVLEGHHPQLLRHAGDARPTSICATNTRCACERLQAAIDECYAAGYLGKNILGSELLARHLSSIAARRPTSAAKRRA